MLLSLAGIPLTAGFIGKVYIFLNALNYQLWFILISIGIGNSIGIYYYFRIISFLYMNVNKKQLIFDLNSFVYYLVLSLSLFILVFGLFPQNIISLIRVFS
ncbi:proton-conducting transporter membrane subunit [Candidatus Portiera aleyrodidarum]|nr:proton-conducting transporter membrane subunit [Candidatus Portiera aleyrodidarum]AUI73161.1 hypothetical protein BBB03_00015 [Candidatus Portiera aleyrodidarum]